MLGATADQLAAAAPGVVSRVVGPGGELDRFEATGAVVATRPVLAWLALP